MSSDVEAESTFQWLAIIWEPLPPKETRASDYSCLQPHYLCPAAPEQAASTAIPIVLQQIGFKILCLQHPLSVIVQGGSTAIGPSVSHVVENLGGS